MTNAPSFAVVPSTDQRVIHFVQSEWEPYGQFFEEVATAKRAVMTEADVVRNIISGEFRHTLVRVLAVNPENGSCIVKSPEHFGHLVYHAIDADDGDFASATGEARRLMELAGYDLDVAQAERDELVDAERRHMADLRRDYRASVL